MPGLEEVLIMLGEMKSDIKSQREDTSALRSDVGTIAKKIKSMEIKDAYDRGVASQNKKIAAAAGSVGGGIVAALASWCKAKGLIP